MDDTFVPYPYAVSDQTKILFNNSHLSDVKFHVGDEKKEVYGHRLILALGSPVFERMLFGELKMDCNEPIEIKDLKSDGFINMIKYIYGFQIEELDFSVLGETLKAGDKYLVYHLASSLLNKLRGTLNVSNCCIIFDQLVQIQNDSQLFEDVRTMIKHNSVAVFSSEFFENISQETLCEILKIENLSITEIEILRACIRWIDAKLEKEDIEPTLDNRRKSFMAIRGLIKFSELTIDNLSRFCEIENLLTCEEIGSLFLHLTNKSRPFMIDCEIPRRRNEILSAIGECNIPSVYLGLLLSSFTLLMNVNAKIFIKSIYTSIRETTTGLLFSINECQEEIPIRYRKKIVENNWCFEFDDLIEIKPTNDYSIKIQFDESYLDDGLLNEEARLECKSSQQTFIFNLIADRYHCIERIDFCV